MKSINLLDPYASSRPFSGLPAQLSHLPSCSYAVQLTVPTVEVFKNLEQHPDYPGVIILDGRKFLGIISRQRCYEQLSQPFGGEIFLRRPIGTLFEKISYAVQQMAASTPIERAVQIVLRRPFDQVYEPILVEHEDHQIHMVDLHDLLLAHSRLLVNANQMIQKQLQVEQSLFTTLDWDEVLQRIFLLAHEMIPYHRAMLMMEITDALHPMASFGFPIYEKHPFTRQDSLEINVYEEIKITQQPLVTIGTGVLRDLSYDLDLAPPQHWIGVPLVQTNRVIGMLALSRLSGKSFSQEEITLASRFCHQAGVALHNAERYQQKGVANFSHLPRMTQKINFSILSTEC